LVRTRRDRFDIFTVLRKADMTRTELCGLLALITAELPTYREGSPQRNAAGLNLRNVRWVLAQRNFSP
jgi:hypothetical protein